MSHAPAQWSVARRRFSVGSLMAFLVVGLGLMLGSSPARASAYPIDQLSAISESQAAALKTAGVENSDQLLEKAATPKDRATLAKATKIKILVLHKWAKMADLLRIPNVGPEAVTILGAVQVDTSKALLKQDPAKLAEKIRVVNEKKKLTEKPPTVESLSAWKDAAQGLPQVLK
jgi:hypothetical protein